MAIVQISRIQHRRGLEADLPNPSLEEGEIGLALDTGRLYIGTPNLPVAIDRANRGEFPYANTEILTEWSDNTSVIKYAYRWRNVNFIPTSGKFVPTSSRASPVLEYPVSGGPYVITPIYRPIQDKLDDMVSVKDYGARGDGFRDLSPVDHDYMISEVGAIRRAALDVSRMNIDNIKGGWSPRKLLFPAGVYLVNDALLIPPYSHWVGEGPENTIIVLDARPTNTIQGYNDCLGFTVDGYVQPNDVFDDAKIQAGSYANLGTNSTIRPGNIIIENMTLEVALDPTVDPTIPFDVLRFIGASNVVLRNCRIIGNWVRTLFGPAGSGEIKSTGNGINPDFYHGGIAGSTMGDSVALVFDSMEHGNMLPSNIEIENCLIANSTYGILLTDDVSNIRITNTTFNRHYRAISVNETLDVTAPSRVSKVFTQGYVGPKDVCVTNCRIINVKREGLANFGTMRITRNNERIEDPVSHVIVSIGNRFDNVGNDFTNDGSFDTNSLPLVNPLYNVIHFGSSEGNVSLSDTFGRSFEPSEVNRVYGKDVVRIDSGYAGGNLVFNLYDPFERPAKSKILTSSTFTMTDTGISYDMTKYDGMIVHYRLRENIPLTASQRIGRIMIVSDGGGTVADTDTSVETSAVQVYLSAYASGNEVNLKYVNNTFENYVFYYSIELVSNPTV